MIRLIPPSSDTGAHVESDEASFFGKRNTVPFLTAATALCKRRGRCCCSVPRAWQGGILKKRKAIGILKGKRACRVDLPDSEASNMNESEAGA